MPASRPARSSPLAAAPLSGEESKAPPSTHSLQFTSALPKPRPASPKTPFGQMSTGQPKPPVPMFTKPEEASRQNSTPFLTGVSSLPPKPVQFATPTQATTAPPPTLKAPPGQGQTPAISSPNAPFIMPQSAPTGPGGMPVSGFGAAAQPPPAQTRFESSMQRECQNLCLVMAEELEQVSPRHHLTLDC